jgi:hypothetical protein
MAVSKMPVHKCIRGMCDPDEGVHCLPERWYSGKTIDDFRAAYRGEWFANLELVKVQRESDVTKKQFEQVLPNYGWDDVFDNPDYTGYLIWLREKSNG